MHRCVNPEPHDTYIAVMAIADETTVPLLMERFRIDYPMGPPEPPPDLTWIDSSPYSIGRIGPGITQRTVQGFSCVRAHLLDALSRATNTYRGSYYPDWKAWWAENRHKSRREWVAQGFEEAGLRPTDPVDEPFGLDLIGLLGSSEVERSGVREHLAINARRLLENVPVAERLEWIQTAARSEQQPRRLGAVAALRRLEPDRHEEWLRTLTADPDAAVRLAALDVLNARLRRHPDRQADAFRVRRPAKADEPWGLAVSDDRLVVAGSRALEAFDVRDGRRLWRRRVGSARQLLILNDRVVAWDHDGTLTAFGPRGRLTWHVPSRGELNDIRQVFAIERSLGVLRRDRLEWRDAETGRVLHHITSGLIRDADASGRTVYVLTDRGLQRLVDGRVLARRDLSGAGGPSVRDSTVCVTRSRKASEGPGEVACYDADTLGAAAAAIRHVGIARAVGIECLRADGHNFRRDSGTPLWADRAGQEVHGHLWATTWGLFSRAPEFRLERRALDSGEVERIWPYKEKVIAVAPSGRLVAIATEDGSLWLIRSHDGGQMVGRPDATSRR